MNIIKMNIRAVALLAALFAGSMSHTTHEAPEASTPSWIARKFNAAVEYFKSGQSSSKDLNHSSNEPKMSLDELAMLSPDEVRTSSIDSIKTWDNIIFLKMNANQTKALSGDQIRSLNQQQTQGLQVKYLTDDQITEVNTKYLLPSQAKYLLPHLSSDQISTLSPLTFGSLPKEKLDKALNRFNIPQLETIENAFKKTNHPFVGKIRNIIALKRSK